MKAIIIASVMKIRHTSYQQLYAHSVDEINRSIQFLKEQGIREIYVTINPNEPPAGGEIKMVDDVQIQLVEQMVWMGTGHAVELCKKYVEDDEFVVLLNPDAVSPSLALAIQNFLDDLEGIILVRPVLNWIKHKGWRAKLAPDRIERLVAIGPEDALVAVDGAYLCKRLILERLQKIYPSWKNEFELEEAFDALIHMPHKIGYQFTSP